MMFSGSSAKMIQLDGGGRVAERALTFEEGVGFLCDLKDKVEGRSMVIWPVVLGHLVIKPLFLVVGGAFRCVNNPKLVPVLFMDEVGH